MNIFRHEFTMMRNTMLVWLLVLCGMACMYIALYPAFSKDVETTKKLLENLPPVAKSAVHLTDQTFLTFLGFFAFTFINLTLAAGMYAMHTGVSLLSREPRSKTTDFLFSKPKGRTNIFLQKFFAGLAVLVLVWGVLTGVAFGLAKAFGAGDFSIMRFGQLMLALLCIQLWLYTFGLLISQLLKRVKSTVSVTLAVTFGFFLINILAGLLKEDKLRYVTPFGFFTYADLAAGKGFDLVFLATAIVSMSAAAVVSYVIYTKRDIRAAV